MFLDSVCKFFFTNKARLCRFRQITGVFYSFFCLSISRHIWQRRLVRTVPEAPDPVLAVCIVCVSLDKIDVEAVPHIRPAVVGAAVLDGTTAVVNAVVESVASNETTAGCVSSFGGII